MKTVTATLDEKDFANAEAFYGSKLWKAMSTAAREKLATAVRFLNKAINFEATITADLSEADRNGALSKVRMSFDRAVGLEAEAFAVGAALAAAA